MNVERLQQLRDYIATVKDRFRYDHYMHSTLGYIHPWYRNQPTTKNDCNTTGCIAGLGVLHFRLPKGEHLTAGAVMKEWLSFNEEEASFLFRYASDDANHSDAMRRMDHLLSGRPIGDYDLNLESYNQPKEEVL